MNNIREEIKEIVSEYCRFFGVKRSDLFRSSGVGRVKKIKGTNLSMIRITLGHYIQCKYPLSMSDIAYMIGYSDHSSMSVYKKKIAQFIETEDRIFNGYYEILEAVAAKIIRKRNETKEQIDENTMA